MNGLGVINKNKLEGWEEIFQCWEKELIDIVNLTSGFDAPYVHAEHGNTHLFGVSAAKAGYATMREVIGNRNGSSARLDIVLISENYLDIVEAKWLEFNPILKSPIPRISDKVKSACEDALSYKNNKKGWFNFRYPTFLIK